MPPYYSPFGAYAPGGPSAPGSAPLPAKEGAFSDVPDVGGPSAAGSTPPPGGGSSGAPGVDWASLAWGVSAGLHQIGEGATPTYAPMPDAGMLTAPKVQKGDKWAYLFPQDDPRLAKSEMDLRIAQYRQALRDRQAALSAAQGQKKWQTISGLATLGLTAAGAYLGGPGGAYAGNVAGNALFKG